MVAVAPSRAKPSEAVDPFCRLSQTTPAELVSIIKRRVPAADAKVWLDATTLGRTATLKALDLPVATFNRKVKANERLSPAESERVIGFARLVGQLQTMVAEADGAAGFDARAWLGRWLSAPLPAFGGARPLDYMDTMEGQRLVSQTLARIESGAYP